MIYHILIINSKNIDKILIQSLNKHSLKLIKDNHKYLKVKIKDDSLLKELNDFVLLYIINTLC
jgi:hypothetical protein